MEVSDYLSAIAVGALIGILGRLVLPGRQRIGIFITFLIGVAAALLGMFVARWLHVSWTTDVRLWRLHWDWIVLGLQVAFAVVGVAIANRLTFSRYASGEERPRRRARRRRAAH